MTLTSSMTRHLRAVPDTPELVVVDIYAAWKADIARIDWKATHIRGDRGVVIERAERPSWKGWMR